MKEYYQHLLSSRFEQDAMKEIDKLLSEELAKPEHKRDYDKIEELTDIHSYLAGTDEQIDEATEQGIAALKEKMHSKHRPHITRKIKILATVACAALVLLAANAFTVSAWDMDVFTAIIHFTKDGFSVEFPKQEAVVLPTSEDDPYGIKTECAKYGLEVEAPAYLPEGFVLGDIDSYESSNYIKYVSFHFYRNKEEAIVIDYSLHNDEKKHGSIPSDNFNLFEITVNGKSAIVSKEDNQYTIIWSDGNLESKIYTYNLDYEESDNIVASLK